MKKDVLIYFAGKIVPAGVNLAIIILAVRLLGKSEYGKYSLIFYAAMLLSTLTFGWIQQGVLRFLSAYPNEQQKVINQFRTLTLFSTTLALVTCAVICVFYFNLNWTETLVVVVYLFWYNLFLFRLSIYQAQLKSVHYTLFEGSYNMLFFITFLIFVYIFIQRVFLVLFIAMTIGLILTFLLNSLFKHDHRGGESWFSFDSHFSRKVFQFGFPITIWLFLSYLLTISDRFIIKEFSSYEDVGTYAAIKDFIIKISTFTTIPILLAYHPTIVERWNRGERGTAMRLIREGLGYCLLITLAVLFFFMIFRNEFYTRILHLTVKGDFTVSFWLICSAFLWQAALMIHKPLELLLKPKLMLAGIVMALTLNGVANFLLVPVYGYAASAVISFISVLTYILFILVFLIRYQRLGMFKS